MNSKDEKHLLGAVIDAGIAYRKLLVMVTSASVIVFSAWFLLKSPNYRADGLIQVEEKTNSGIRSLGEMASALGDSTTVAAEVEILTSRLVLNKVVDQLNLDIAIEKRSAPVLGKILLKDEVQIADDEVPFGLKDYAWGEESLNVSHLSVPSNMLDEKLELTVVEKGKFELKTVEGRRLVAGAVGQLISEGAYEIFVESAPPRTGATFVIKKKSIEKAINELRSVFVVKERGKKSGILEVTLTSGSAQKSAQVLDKLMMTYVRQNIARRSAEAENTIRFLEEQMPSVKRDMDDAEREYNKYRQLRGSLDLSLETQSVIQSLVEIDNQIVAVKQEYDELRQGFTQEHPRVQAVLKRLSRLNERRLQFDSEVKRLPDTQQRLIQLAREVEVKTALYTNLLNTYQELKVTKAGTVGDVRIIDSALVAKDAVGPSFSLVFSSSILVGLLLSAVTIAILKAMRVTIEDPSNFEETTGLPVFAVVPHSNVEKRLINDVAVRGKNAKLLAIESPDDPAIESLRGLRATMQFNLLSGGEKKILITGSAPNMGKSFISKNLAAVLAMSGLRVVIVDADIRRGHIHKEFGLPRNVGITEFVMGTESYENVVKHTTVENLFVVTTGLMQSNPAEVLMNPRFKALLDQLEASFDLVVVDAPPVLAVSDALVLCRLTDIALLVVRDSMSSIAEIRQTAKAIEQAGASVSGCIFNDYNFERQRYRYGYKGYVYRYTYDK